MQLHQPQPFCSPLPLQPTRVRNSLRKDERYTPLTLWHLLSLDAPTVAALWTWFIAWCAGVRLSAADPVAMFVAVWMLYACDRLLDARPLSARLPVSDLEERHHFHHRHRRWFLCGIVAGALALTILLRRLLSPVLQTYAPLAMLLLGWLLLVHARPFPSTSAHRLPKELAVGLFFPAAVFIPTVARNPGLRIALVPEALLFAGSCTLNCLFLYAWEHPRGNARAHASTRWCLQHLNELGIAVALAAAACAVVSAWRKLLLTPAALPNAAAPFLACLLSAALLLLLHARQKRFAPLQLRALADVALLTPIPFLLLWAGMRLHR